MTRHQSARWHFGATVTLPPAALLMLASRGRGCRLTGAHGASAVIRHTQPAADGHTMILIVDARDINGWRFQARAAWAVQEAFTGSTLARRFDDGLWLLTYPTFTELITVSAPPRASLLRVTLSIAIVADFLTSTLFPRTAATVTPQPESRDPR